MELSSKKFIKKFGLKMRGFREKRGWTLEKTEEYGWGSWQHLQRIESGNKNVSLVTIMKLSKLYKVTLSELLKDL